MELSKELKLKMYKQMLQIRLLEEKVDEFFKKGLMWGTCHLYIGQEATAVGAIATLNSNDYITSTHRGHGHCVAKGADLKKMVAELLGKETGYCRGRGGSMHIADLDTGNLGANGIVGGGIPIAVGAGFSSIYNKDGKVTLCFFGDGATNTGIFHESVNLASLWNLPVVFICENNLYGMSVPFSKSSAVNKASERAFAYGIAGEQVDGNDVEAVYQCVKKAVDRARNGEGPTLIESLTYRWKGHSKSDANVYRTKEEIQDWMQRCPIMNYKNHLIQNSIFTHDELSVIEKEVELELNEAEKFAKESPEPRVEDILNGNYA